MFDASAIARMTRPVLATSTDGVGTKVAIAQALDRHDTIGSTSSGWSSTTSSCAAPSRCS
jgi:phosphoribosylaminoimidazole (AIR) synthetase